MGTKHISGSSEDAPVASRDVQEMSQRDDLSLGGWGKGGIFYNRKRMRQDALRCSLVWRLPTRGGLEMIQDAPPQEQGCLGGTKMPQDG